jgi:bifunctional UDP-N-acetylglucosamine pyrophosphorylase/glucosamine-1-phosphate N-acetyltransferase
MYRFASIVLSAGKSTRMKSPRSKLLYEVGGVPIIARVARVLGALKTESNVFVVSYQKEEILDTVRRVLPDAVAVDQGEPRGTGHAVQSALPALPDWVTDVIVLAGDVPLLSADSLRRLMEMHSRAGALASFLTFVAENPFGYGRVLRDGPGEVEYIMEQTECTPEQLKVTECNSGVYVFCRKWLDEAIPLLRSDNKKGEFFLTDLIMLAVDKVRVPTITVPESEVMGVNTQMDLARAKRLALQSRVLRFMEEGVCFAQPDTVDLHDDVEIAGGAMIEGQVSLRGSTVIEACARIGQGSVLENARIGEHAKILPYTVIEDSQVRAGARVGPYSHLRPGSDVGENAHVGNFVELKKATLAAGVKANHLSYLGDVTIGEASNIGAGTITCNYDGKNKYHTTLGAGVFVGSDSQLVAPVTVGDGAYVGTGTTVLHDVPAGALVINPKTQEVRPGWIAPFARERKP